MMSTRSRLPSVTQMWPVATESFASLNSFAIVTMLCVMDLFKLKELTNYEGTYIYMYKHIVKDTL